jgi:diacylglycerol kinase family enzyme
MRHLFIINPKARRLKGRIGEIVREIEVLFAKNPQTEYHIHITRWRRDAAGYARRYAYDAEKIVRVYAVGGTGTLFDVINGMIGLPNVQVAFWPFGRDNSFLRYFEEGKRERFHSLRNLIFARVTPFNVIRCGNNYGICFGSIGLGAIAARRRDRIAEYAGISPGFPGIICLALGAYRSLKNERAQFYNVVIDGESRRGKYISLLAANWSRCAEKARVSPDAGYLDLYLVKNPPLFRLFAVMADYIRGDYHKWPQYISHFRGKKISISSERVMSICIDGEYFYDAAIDCELIPCAIDFVWPQKAGSQILAGSGSRAAARNSQTGDKAR